MDIREAFDLEAARQALELTETMDGLRLEGNNRKVTALLSLRGHLEAAIAAMQSQPTNQDGPVINYGTMPAMVSGADPVGVREEQEAFEKFASSRSMNMELHPLHYLFLDEQTDAARSGWRAALEFMGYTHPAPTAQDSKVPEEWRLAMSQLVYAARTTGGTAGPDELLKHVCSQCEKLLSETPSLQPGHTEQPLAMVAEKPQWVSCEERMPTETDSDFEGCIWVSNDGGETFTRWFLQALLDYADEFVADGSMWHPTGLQRPQPPEKS